LVGDVLNFETIARTRLFATWELLEVAGALAYYDLPDLVAARAPTATLVLGPVAGDLSPVSPDALSLTYSFAASVFGASAAALKLVPGPLTDWEAAAAVEIWVRSLL
jgi:hypothetical protein